ncbi:hypothetical protein NDU88_001132 [Pleurodeles waltl]|uniref:Uncharacterized protein n=1 Tax=Pleurodeles waltl TaxID=8319 RepID=A0AAV7NBI7_PLEWA|nr:hypothetical protein NDU88_001132 [Pleurodeles waltl]
MATAALCPRRKLFSPPFGFELLSSGVFMVQRWVEGSPPRVRRRVAALWPRFVSNTCRPRTALQLSLCVVIVSSRHRGPAFLVRSWCRSQALCSFRAPGLPASLVQHLLRVFRV